MKKKILLLGGAYAQVPIIKEAKSRGMYVITCDYKPENPGHQFADEYFNISTTDIEGVLKLAKAIKPDLVVAYATDPATPVAAYVSEQLKLSFNTYKSVKLLAEKDLFRTLLAENGFNTPKVLTLKQNDNYFDKTNSMALPLIVKPTDSSGSKGIRKINSFDDLNDAVEYALGFSRSKKVIIEEFIDNDCADIHGDGFVVDGELKFACLGDHIYNSKSNPFNPIGTLWPSRHSNDLLDKIKHDVARIIRLSGLRCGPINIEARVNREGKHYIMEIGPRNGGHFVPQAIKYATGFNMVKGYLDVLQGEQITIPDDGINPTAYYALHSDHPGRLKDIENSSELQPYIKEFHQYIKPGENVKSFQGANAAIGVILLSFKSYDEMRYYSFNIEKYISIKVI